MQKAAYNFRKPLLFSGLTAHTKRDMLRGPIPRHPHGARGVAVQQNSPEQVTQLLVRWRDGDRQALDALMPIVYTELRGMAHRYLQRERSDHTLQSTALVHEAYVPPDRPETAGVAESRPFFRSRGPSYATDSRRVCPRPSSRQAWRKCLQSDS